MRKWSNGARKRKAALDQREELASDMEKLVAGIAKLPPGQLKKVLSDEVCAVLAKHGIVLD